MGCRGDSCEVQNSIVRVKQASPEQKVRVEAWLREFFDQCVREGRYDLAERLMKEELKKP